MAARTPDGRTTAASSMTTAEVRFGYPAARSKATMPPMLCPTTAGFSSLSQLAHPRKIVGKDLHRVRLVRLVAPSVPAQVHGNDAVAPVCEVLELGREVGVVTAPAVHQQDGRVVALRFLVEQVHSVPAQRLQAILLSHRFLVRLRKTRAYASLYGKVRSGRIREYPILEGLRIFAVCEAVHKTVMPPRAWAGR